MCCSVYPPLGQVATSGAATIFYVTLLFIFLTAIVTTVATKWARDKCLKFVDGYRVTLERSRGQTIWGTLKVFSSGIEIVYDHPFIDYRGRQKNSFLIYQAELDQQMHALLRFHPAQQEERMAESLAAGLPKQDDDRDVTLRTIRKLRSAGCGR